MPRLEVTDEQVITLVSQLSPHQKEALLKSLLTQAWGTWGELSGRGEAGVRRVAQERGCDWNKMSEEEREAFIDEVVHEDRECPT